MDKLKYIKVVIVVLSVFDVFKSRSNVYSLMDLKCISQSVIHLLLPSHTSSSFKTGVRYPL